MPHPSDEAAAAQDAPMNWSDILRRLRRRAALLLLGPLLVGALAYGASFLLPTLYASQVVFLPPQAQRSTAAAAMSSALGSLGSLAGVGLGTTPSDQYVALMQSRTAFDEIIDAFDLIRIYDVKLRADAYKRLAKLTGFSVGKKDGLITVSVLDEDRERAARMANRFVSILQTMNGRIALTEAQQRRKFFEGHLEATREKLATAQKALQATGFGQGALQAEPKAAAEGFARLKAEVTAAEVRLQVLIGRFAENAPEVVQQRATLEALRAQLRRVESAGASPSPTAGPDYIGRFREFKYQETLFEMYARQFELARADESREGSMIQVIDPAVPAERKSSPQRAVIAASAAAFAALALALWVLLRSEEAPAG